MKLLLVGNFGVGNLGDEALKEFFLTRFREIEWIVVSADPKGVREVPRLPLGLRSFLKPWGKTLRAMATVDGVVFGGGSLLTDIESPLACVLWWLHAKVARVIFGKQLFFAFQGIGPFRTGAGRWFAKSAITSASFVSVRDEYSLARVQEWKYPNPVLTFDPVLRIIDDHQAFVEQGRDVVALIPRANSSDAFMSKMKEVLANKHPDEVRIISLQPDHPKECALCAALPEHLGMPCTCRQAHTLRELADALTGVRFVVTERYHGGIAAIGLGIPFVVVSQGKDDKLASLRMYESGSHKLDSLALVQWGEEELWQALRVLEVTPGR